MGKRACTYGLVLGVVSIVVTSSVVAMGPRPLYKAAPKTGKSAARIAPKPTVAAVGDLPKGPAPKAVFDNEDFDFGEIWSGPLIKHSFVITNKGDAALEILRVKPSCGCTIAGDYPKKLEPGESGKLPFSLNSVRLRGRFAKSVLVTTNDPAHRDRRLKLMGMCKRFVDVLPANAMFGKIGSDESQERVLKITNNTDEKLTLSINPLDDKPFTYKLIEKTPGKEFELHVSLTPPFNSGRLMSKATLTTNVEKQKTIPVISSATIPPRLDVQPSRITIRPSGTSAQNSIRRPIRLTNYGKTPVKVLEAISDDPQIKVSVNERTAGKAYMINLLFPPHYVPPANGRMLTIKTDDPQRPLIQVPIGGFPVRQARRTQKTPTRPSQQLIGKPAPAFSIKTIAGKNVGSSDFSNHPATILNFVAANCGYCKKQVPRVEKLRARYEAKGVRFVNVVQTMRKKFATNQVIDIYNKKLGSHLELAHDADNNVGKLYRATSYPTMVVVDRNGKVKAVNNGNLADLESRLKSQLDSLIAGKPVSQIAAAKPAKRTPPKQPRKRPVELLVGKPAPAFSIQTVDGKEVGSKDFAKHPATVLDFVAANCGFCKKQTPRVEKIREQYESKGVRFVNVVQTMRKKYPTDEVVSIYRKLGVKYEIAHDADNRVGGLYKASGYPTMVIVGKSGKVEAVNIGNIGDLEKRMKGQLDALIAGKPVPQIAAATPPKRTPPKQPRKRPVDLLVGKPAPAFSIQTVDGKEVGSKDFAKHPATVLDFVAANCGFCKKQTPRVEKIREQYESKGVRFVNVVQTMHKKFPTNEVVSIYRKLGVKYEIAHDADNRVGGLYKASGYPTMVIVGKSGKVEAVNVGNIGDLEKRMKGQLDALIAGKPVPQFAVNAPSAQPRKRPVELLVGKPAPAFSIQTVDGKEVGSKDFAKHPATVLDFVAANCGFCKKQTPRVEKIREQYESKGVRFVNVVQTMHNRKYPTDEVVSIYRKLGVKYEIAHDADNRVGRVYKATAYPSMVIVGKSGKVEAVNVGNIGDLEKRMKGQLDALIAGKTVPQFAAKAPQNRNRRPAEDMVGRMAPSFTFKTFDGKTVSNAELSKHSATVLNFVAPNCPFCHRQIPNVEKVRADYEKKGVRFVNVAMTLHNKVYAPDEVVKVFKDLGSHLELARDPKNKIGPLFKASSFPTMVVVDRTGKIAHVNIGAKKNLDTLLKGQLDTLIARK